MLISTSDPPSAGRLSFKLLVFSFCFLLYGAVRAAPPPIIFPSTQLKYQGETFIRVRDAAISGTRVAALEQSSDSRWHLLIWDRLSNSNWGEPTALDLNASDDGYPGGVALGNTIVAAFLPDTKKLFVAELTSAGWQVSGPIAAPNETFQDVGLHVRVAGGQVLVSAISDVYQVLVYEKNSAGQWAYTTRLRGGPVAAKVPYPSFDVSGNTAVLASPALDSTGRGYVFTRSGSSWVQSATLELPAKVGGGFGVFVAISGSQISVSRSSDRNAIHLFRLSNGVWNYAGAAVNPIFEDTSWATAINGNLAAAVFNGDILVYDTSSGGPRTIAELIGGGAWRVGISGRSVLAVEDWGLSVFEVPTTVTQPTAVDDNFEDGNANGWTPSNGNTWSVVSRNGSRVYRQTSYLNSVHAKLANTDWSTIQAVEADVTITAVQGTAPWVAVAARYQDSNNYYYLSLRASNHIQIRKRENGVSTVLARWTYPVNLNQTYRLRIEVWGDRIWGYVNNVPVIEADESTFTHGSAALFTQGAQADFDNVRVTPTQLREFFADYFTQPSINPGDLELARGPAWVKVSGNWVDPPDVPEPVDSNDDPYAAQRNYHQTYTGGPARTYTGLPAGDQVVEVKASADKLVSGGWFGVMARYVDSNNHYYLRLGDGRVSLRKYVNGNYSELASAAFPISANTYYTLRLEVVGTTLRGYINNRVVLDARDSSIAAGRYGLATHRTAVKFDNFIVRQP